MSHRSYNRQKPIIHSRESSIDSRTSYSTRSSTEDYHSSSSTRTSMAKGYYDSRGNPVDGVKYHRVPDNNTKYITSSSKTKVTSKGDRTVQVVDHQKARYDYEEPRASNATSEDYKKTQERKDRRSTMYVR